MTDNAADLQGARILLVDDQPANLDVLNRLLKRKGCDISVAPSGPVALKRLVAYHFPGNMRELKNIIERALIESQGEIRAHHLHLLSDEVPAEGPPVLADLPPDLPLEEVVAQAEVWAVQRAIDRAQGNISEAARLLGTNRNKIYRVLGQEKGAG